MGNEEKEEEVMATPKYEYLSHSDMDSYYAEVCRAMAGAQYKPDVIIALSRGGLEFGVKLSNWFDDVPMIPISWQTRSGDTQQESLLRDALAQHKGAQSVLIVDDINDSGKTLLGIDAVVKAATDPFSVDYAVAIENTESDFETTWNGREIHRSEDTQWFVFPWENWWKN